MAYTVNNFNGAFLTNVADGTIDTTTDIRFVGKNYAGYGEIQNENFLHLMENFANITPPSKAVIGQIWYDSTSTEKKLKFWDGNNWRNVGGAKSQTTAPSGLSTGEFWWDSTAKQLYAWSGTEFVLVGPDTAPDLGASAVSARVVKDIFNQPHTIIEFKAGGSVVAIVNGDSAFKLDVTQNSIPGFNPPSNEIKQGITLINTNASGVTTDSHVIWGTSSAARGLVGSDNTFKTADEIIGLTEGDFRFNIKFGDVGFVLGDRDNFSIKVEDTDQLIVQNTLSENITIRIGPTAGSNTVIFNNTGIIPAGTDSFNLGSIDSRWDNVFVKTIIAENITGTVFGTTEGVHKGNVIAANSAIMLNSATNVIGVPDGSTLFLAGKFGDETAGPDNRTEFYGTLLGNADSASRLQGFFPEEQVPTIGSKASVPVRDSNGNIYATNFIASGSANKSDQLAIFDQSINVGYFNASWALPSVSNKISIAARNEVGDIYARFFQGTATAARYADLAEKYLTDKEYEVGTVVSVGGDAEVTASNWGDRAIGVVSENPAFMMNKDLEGGTYVALKGRVPVKVIGSIRKGDRLVASNSGYAIHASFHQHPDVFAIALESSEDTGVKLIESVIL
jgi:hypothetical protein